MAAAVSVADGPIPIGEVVGAEIITGAIAWDLVDSKNKSPEGAQYTLRAKTSGLYPVYTRGSVVSKATVYLNKGDIWKIGETMQYDAASGRQWRYTQLELNGWGVEFQAEYLGPKSAIQVMEGIKLIGYITANGELPPGNKILK